MSSDGEEEAHSLSKWPPTPVVCVIDDALLCELAGLDVRDPHLLQHLSRLTALDLHLRDGAKGKIRRIENLNKLPSLSQLNLSHNALHKMEGLASLRQLVELNLAENSITRIEGIFHMKHLERLNLCGNMIERLPSSMTSLRSLSAIRLNRNRLSDLRDLEHFREMHTLRNLRVDNNLFPAPPPSQSLRSLILQAVTPALQVLDNQTITATEREEAGYVDEQRQSRTEQQHPSSVSSSESTGSSSSSSLSISLASKDKRADVPPRSHPPSSRQKQQQLNLSLLQQRLGAEQRRAELLEEEAQQARKHYRQLMSSPSPGGRSPLQQAASRRELDLISRLRTEKSNEAIEAKALVSQLQQEITFQEIDNTFDQWGADASPPPSSSASSTSDDSSTKHFQNIYSRSNIREQQERNRYAGGDAVLPLQRRPETYSAADTAKHSPPVSASDLSRSLSRPLHSTTIPAQVSRGQGGVEEEEEEDKEGTADLTVRLELVTSQLQHTESERARLQDALEASNERLRVAEREASSSKSKILSLEHERLQDKSTIKMLTQQISASKSTPDAPERGGDDQKAVATIERLQEEVDRWRHVSAEREAEVAALHNQLTAASAAASAPPSSREIQHHSFAASSNIMGMEKEMGMDHETELKILTKTVGDLQLQLEEAQRDGSASRDSLIQLRKENSALRESLQDQLRGEESGIGSTADMLKQLKAQLASRDSRLQEAEGEAARLRQSLQVTRGELEAALRSSSNTINNKTKTNNPNTNPGSRKEDSNTHNGNSAERIAAGMSTKNLHRDTVKARENYFDETESSIDLSSDQDQDLMSLFPNVPNPLEELSSKHQQVRNSRMTAEGAGDSGEALLRGAQIHATADGLRGHETAAAHSLAAAILEELKAAFAASPVPPAHVPVSQLKRACVNAALRLICSAANTLRNRHQKSSSAAATAVAAAIPPLEVFGEAAVIAQLVSEGQAALELLSDTKHLRLEKLQVERVLGDLNDQIKQIESDRVLKEKAISMLSKQCDETKQHAQATLADLNAVMEKLREGRKSVLAQDQLLIIKKKEIEAANVEFEDINKLSQMEHKNVDAVRMRLRALHQDKAACETQLAEVRQKFSLEESRFRNAKSVGTTEIRGLHEELVQLQSQQKQRHKELEALRKAGEVLEEQQEQRQREAHQQHVQRLRAVEDGRRVLTSLEGEMSKARSDLEALVQRKKKVSTEVAEAEEQVLSLRRQGESEVQEARRALNDKEKEIKALEKTLRVSKERVTEMEKDQSMLTLVLENLKRQQIEFEKNVENRKREAEEELEAVQGSLSAANRALRACALANEQKRAEAETLLSDTRAQQRKQEDRATDDLRRSIRALQDEESEWKDRMARAKAAYNQIKTSTEEAQSDIDMVRASNERERRDLSETRSKKSQVEAELSRHEEELKYVQEQVREEEKRRAAGAMEAAKSQEEAGRWQRELLETQRRCSEARKLEEQLRRREAEAGQLKDRLRAEVDGLASLVAAEQLSMDSVRSEKDLMLSEFKQVKEELRQRQKELGAVTSSLETSKAQMAHLDTVKESLQSEVSNLRDSVSLEIARAERVSEAHKEAERRGRESRKELERVQIKLAEEEARCAEARRALVVATDELSKMEARVVESSEIMHSQRNKAIEEISQLGQLKKSVQNDVLILSDSKQRQERLHPTRASSLAAPPSHEVVSSVLDQQGRLLPTVRVFEDAGLSQSYEDPDISRELDETVFRSLQEAQQQALRSRRGREGADEDVSAATGRRQPHDTVSGQITREGVSGGRSSSNSNDSSNDVIDLRSEMQKLRDQTAAILS